MALGKRACQNLNRWSKNYPNIVSGEKKLYSPNTYCQFCLYGTTLLQCKDFYRIHIKDQSKCSLHK